VEKIYLFNENFVLTARIKNWARKIFGKGPRGPEAVFLSLVTGLREQDYQVFINNTTMPQEATACVLSGVSTLMAIIHLKRKGKIAHIVAGPNLVVSPEDEQAVLMSPEIDIVVVPSEWVKEYYGKISPQLIPKLRVWAAGVEEVPKRVPFEKKHDFLVFNKIKGGILANDIIGYLTAKNYKVWGINYGKFEQGNYFELLRESKFMVYISETESQGLAMFEAWARGVPTLVYERGFFERNGHIVRGKTAAPYISEEAGETFQNFEEFKSLVEAIPIKKFDPQEYVRKYFTHSAAAEKYLNIVNSL
jgi:hypothetical protein